MTFKLELFPRQELVAETLESGRTYETPDGKFRSVTTVLSNAADKSGLIAWRKKIGNEAANKITKDATNFGSKLHALAESYLRGEEQGDILPQVQNRFEGIRELLDKNVTTIYGIEYPLYSTKLKAAGTTDLVCLYDGKLSIVDFKTARSPKKTEWILNYFLQSTCYAMMLEERKAVVPEQIVIMISAEGLPNPQIFIRDPGNYKAMVEDVFVRGAKFK